jgi:hypothetical protein
MGYLLNAHCPQCGFEKQGLRFGYGMMRKEPLEFPAPCLNMKNRGISTKNILIPLPSNIRTYTDAAMFKSTEDEARIDFSDYSLSCKGNYCPACKGFTMEFDIVANTD